MFEFDRGRVGRRRRLRQLRSQVGADAVAWGVCRLSLDSDPALVIFEYQERSSGAVRRCERLPTWHPGARVAELMRPERRRTVLDGVQLDVLRLVLSEPLVTCSSRSMHRPVVGGVSCGPARTSAAAATGTLGLRAVDTRTGAAGMITASHVVNSDGMAQIGDVILQPGVMDLGVAPGDAVGGLLSFVRLQSFPPVPVVEQENYADAAFVQVDSCVLQQLGDARPIVGWMDQQALNVGDEVVLFGRTSGTSSANILSTEGAYQMTDSMRGTVTLLEDQILTSRLAEWGDSGGAVFAVRPQGTLAVIGIVVGGASSVCCVTPIENVLDELGLDLQVPRISAANL